jgi:hypothetical protein
MTHEKKYSKSQLQRREQIEAELSSIPVLPTATRKLTSREGFADYYLAMQDLYPSQRLAYERLEDFHIDVTGHRRYSEFNSFRKSLDRLLEQQKE